MVSVYCNVLWFENYNYVDFSCFSIMENDSGDSSLHSGTAVREPVSESRELRFLNLCEKYFTTISNTSP